MNLILKLYYLYKRSFLSKYSIFIRIHIILYYMYKYYYEDHLANLFKKYPNLLGENDVIDIGACIGYTSLLMNKYTHKESFVHAFEPDLENLNILRQVVNRKKNNKINIYPYAVGNKDEEILFFYNEKIFSDHRVITNKFKTNIKNNSNIKSIKMLSIDQWIVNNTINKISFIKIDVQGYELEVLKGMDNTISMNPNCKILFEYCPSVMIEMGYNPKDLLSYFLKKEYFLYEVRKDGLFKFNIDENILNKNNSFEYIDLLASINVLK